MANSENDASETTPHNLAELVSSRTERWREQQIAAHRRFDHARRCRTLPPLQPGEVERLTKAFIAAHGGITQCPTAFVAPVVQAGLDRAAG